jgi:hypothetical protein
MTTLAQAITMTLNRVGLNPSTTAYKDQARLYLNVAAKRISAEIGGKWWWLHKSTTFVTTKTITITVSSGVFTVGETVTGGTSGTMVVTGISGTFVAGETVTGGTSGRTGVITTAYGGSTSITLSSVSGTFTSSETITGGTSSATATFSSFTASSCVVDAAYDATNHPTALLINALSGAFTASETLTGGSSGASGTYSSIAVTQTYALASDVLVPHSFVDVSNDRVLASSGWDRIDRGDPDRDYETDARVWTPEGIDAITGKQIVRLFPYHDTMNDTIRYRYRGFIADWTSDDDSTSLDRWMPQILQPALPFGAAEYYNQEKGDSEAAGENRFEYSDVVDRAKETNRTIWGNRVWRRGNLGPESFQLAPGSLIAAS